MTLSSLLLVFWLFCLSSGSRPVYRTSLPSLRHAASTGRIAQVRKALQEVGGFAVEGLGQEYATALESLQTSAPHCLDGSKRVTLYDGAERFTFVESDREPLPSCLQAQAEIIQATFDQVELHVTSILSQIVGNSSLLTRESGEVKQLSELPSKTHVHVYKSSHTPSNAISQPHTLPFHRDNGLYLLVTPSPSAPLLLQSAKGKPVSTSLLSPTSVLFLLGRGLTSWLLQTTPHGLVPAPHAVPSMAGAAARTVLARMKVADDDAVPARRGGKAQLTFHQVFNDGTISSSPASLCHYGGPLTEEEFLTRHKRAACWPHTGENCDDSAPWECRFVGAKNPCARERYSFSEELGGGGCKDDRDCDSFTCCNVTGDETQGQANICNSLQKFCNPHGAK